jgi:hypothetical protein
MAIDDVLDRGRDARRRRERARGGAAGVESLARVDLLDAARKRGLARLRDRPRTKRASGRREAMATSA